MSDIIISTVGKHIRKGAYGQIYLAQYSDREIDKDECIVKILDRRDHIGRDAIIESMIMNSIHHPYIASCKYNPIAIQLPVKSKVNGVYLSRESDVIHVRTNICQQLATHGDLESAIDIKGDRELFLTIAYQIISALCCLHGVGIIHCDIKPSNILRFDGNIVKLADFSISSFIAHNNKHISGSPYYWSPESMTGITSWDTSSDIWSLGCTLYRLWYGVKLFPEQPCSTVDGDRKGEIIRKKHLTALCKWKNVDKSDYISGDIGTVIDINDELLSSGGDINSLIISMLNINPVNRPTIVDIMNNRIFIDHRKPDAYISTISDNEFIYGDDKYLTPLCINNSLLFESSIRLFCKAKQLIYIMGEERLANSCVSICHRVLLISNHPSISINTQDELDILHYTNFLILDCFITPNRH